MCAFRMRSRVNRGTPEQPGLVYALMSGGLCRGMVYRLPQARADQELARLWHREMPTGVYDPRWLRCETPHGPVTALAFTLSRRSPNYTGELDAATYRRIMAEARRFNVCCAGRRFGKSRFGLRLVSDTMLQARPAACLSPAAMPQPRSRRRSPPTSPATCLDLWAA